MDIKKSGKFLAKLRKERGLTQTNLASILNVTHQAISRWERGDSIPDIQTLVSLSHFYGITIDEIINGELSNVEYKKLYNQEVFYKVKKMHILALSLIILSLVLFYGITWITYYEAIGFIVQFILIIFGVVLFLFGYHDLLKEVEQKEDNSKIQSVMKYLKQISILVIILVILSITLSMPYILYDPQIYDKTIISIQHYLNVVLYNIIIGGVLSYLLIWLVNHYFYNKWKIAQYKYKYSNYYYVIIILLVLIIPNSYYVRTSLLLLTSVILLILNDFILIIKNQDFLFLRLMRILTGFYLILLGITVLQQRFSLFDFVIDIRRIILVELICTFLLFLLYYIIKFIINYKKSSFEDKLIYLIRYFLFLLFIFSYSIFLQNEISGINYIPKDFMYLILLYIVLDLGARLAIEHLINRKKMA